MKKIIESELISIAHRILKLKDKGEVATLLKETELLHNQLVLLKFYEDNKFRLDQTITEEKLFDVLKHQNETLTNSNPSKTEMPDYMSADIINELLEDTKNQDVVAFEEDLDFEEGTIENVEVEEQLATQESQILENKLQENNEVISVTQEPVITEEVNLETEVATEFTPSIEETQKTIEEVEEEIQEIEQHNPQEDFKEAVERVSLDIDPVFSMATSVVFENDEVASSKQETEVSKEPVEDIQETQHLISQQTTDVLEPYRQAPINRSINDAFAQKIAIGLNDRIAFEKHLFNGNGNDLNKVIAQLNTFDTYQEALDFIDDLVKPEFNYWRGKEDYENRFMELVEKRFL